MHLSKIIQTLNLSSEERAKHLEKVKSEISKHIQNNNIKVGASDSRQVGSVGSIDNIPDINTAVGYPGVATSIKNNTKHDIYYWYTFDGSQKWYYKYTIGAGATTWNWQWADSRTHHSMIIEIPINDGSGQSMFYVVAFANFDIFQDYSFPRFYIYSTKSKSDHPPLFNQKVWTFTHEVTVSAKSLDWVFDFHANIGCYDDQIVWEV